MKGWCVTSRTRTSYTTSLRSVCMFTSLSLSTASQQSPNEVRAKSSTNGKVIQRVRKYQLSTSTAFGRVWSANAKVPWINIQRCASFFNNFFLSRPLWLLVHDSAAQTQLTRLRMRFAYDIHGQCWMNLVGAACRYKFRHIVDIILAALQLLLIIIIIAGKYRWARRQYKIKIADIVTEARAQHATPPNASIDVQCACTVQFVQCSTLLAPAQHWATEYYWGFIRDDQRFWFIITGADGILKCENKKKNNGKTKQKIVTNIVWASGALIVPIHRNIMYIIGKLMLEKILLVFCCSRMDRNSRSKIKQQKKKN